MVKYSRITSGNIDFLGYFSYEVHSNTISRSRTRITERRPADYLRTLGNRRQNK